MNDIYDNTPNTELLALLLDVGEGAYKLIATFPEEEKWTMANRCQNAATDSNAYISEGVGSIDPRDRIWALGKGRAALFALESTLKLAHRTGLIKTDPEVMLSISKAVKMIDQEVTSATTKVPGWFSIMSAEGKK